MNANNRIAPRPSRDITPDVALIVNHRSNLIVTQEERIQHMEDDFWNNETKLGLSQTGKRNPEKNTTTNAFWKIAPNKMKVELFGDIGNENNLLDCFRIR